MLSVGTGLLLKSLLCLTRVHPGFEANNVLTMSIGSALQEVPGGKESRDQKEAVFWSQLLERTCALAGVQAAALSDAYPMCPGSSTGDEVNARRPVKIEGRQLPPPGYLLVRYQDVSPDYFRALGIPLRRGRFFEVKERDPAARNPSGDQMVKQALVLDRSCAVANPVRLEALQGSPDASRPSRFPGVDGGAESPASCLFIESSEGFGRIDVLRTSHANADDALIFDLRQLGERDGFGPPDSPMFRSRHADQCEYGRSQDVSYLLSA